MSYKQKAKEHLDKALSLQERLNYIEERAVEAVRANDPYLAGRLDTDPRDLAVQNEVSYRVGIRMQKYTNVASDMSSSRNRHLQWAQTYGILALLEEADA